MAQTSEPRWAQIADDVQESVKVSRDEAIAAVSKFRDKISSAVPEQSRHQTVVEAALDLADELHTTGTQLARSVVRSAGQAAGKQK